MSSDRNNRVDSLVKQAQSIQKQMDRLTSELRDLKLKIKEEDSSKKLKVGDVVMITTRERNGTHCVVSSFTPHRVSLITLDTKEKVIRKATNLTLLHKK